MHFVYLFQLSDIFYNFYVFYTIGFNTPVSPRRTNQGKIQERVYL